ncbi:hypothetical protein D3C81_758600 [compost metagenome]
MLRIRDDGAQGNGTGALVNGDVGEFQGASRLIALAVIQDQADRHFAAVVGNGTGGDSLFELEEIVAGLGDVDIHRIQLLHRRQRAALAGGHQRTFGDAGFADAPGDWRNNLGVLQVDACAFQCCAGGNDVGIGLPGLGHAGVELLRADVVFGPQRLLTLYGQMRYFAAGLGLFQIAQRAVAGGLIAGRVDLIQRLTGLHVTAFNKLALEDNTADLRPDFRRAVSVGATRQFCFYCQWLRPQGDNTDRMRRKLCRFGILILAAGKQQTAAQQ